MMSQMISQIIGSYSYSTLTGVGMLLFMAVFLATTVWVFRKGGKTFYQNLALMPLQEESEL